jgi:hypothetical protein
MTVVYLAEMLREIVYTDTMILKLPGLVIIIMARKSKSPSLITKR